MSSSFLNSRKRQKDRIFVDEILIKGSVFWIREWGKKDWPMFTASLILAAGSQILLVSRSRRAFELIRNYAILSSHVIRTGSNVSLLSKTASLGAFVLPSSIINSRLYNQWNKWWFVFGWKQKFQNRYLLTTNYRIQGSMIGTPVCAK